MPARTRSASAISSWSARSPPTRHRSGSPPSTRPTRRCATRPTGSRNSSSRSQPKNDSFESIAADLHARLRDVRLPVDMLLSWADSP